MSEASLPTAKQHPEEELFEKYVALAESCILLRPEAPAFRIMRPAVARSDLPPVQKVEKVGLSGRGEHRGTPG